jgi:hypothetical protein
MEKPTAVEMRDRERGGDLTGRIQGAELGELGPPCVHSHGTVARRQVAGTPPAGERRRQGVGAPPPACSGLGVASCDSRSREWGLGGGRLGMRRSQRRGEQECGVGMWD